MSAHANLLLLACGTLFGALVFLVEPCTAQSLGGHWESILELPGSTYSGEFGQSIASGGDLDGDGYPDLVIGSAGTWDLVTGSGFIPGEVFVLSGASGNTIHWLNGIISDNFGFAVAGNADLNGDGVPDFVVGSPGFSPPSNNHIGRVQVFSGTIGSQIWEAQGTYSYGHFGFAVAMLGDIDGDGVLEVAVGCPRGTPNGIGGAGLVSVFSGVSGIPIWETPGARNTEWLGSSLARIPDITGDGIEDLACGAIGANPGGLPDAGMIQLLSGIDGSTIYKVYGSNRNSWFGYSVASIGDIDGDGISDWAAGAPLASPGGRSYAGLVSVHSGRTGGMIRNHEGELAGDYLGTSVSGGTDLDFDGNPDYACGGVESYPGWIGKEGIFYIFSGDSGVQVLRLVGESTGDNFGSAHTVVGDLTDDAIPELAISARWASPFGYFRAGQVQIFALDPFLTLESDQISVSAGVDLRFLVDFPQSEAHFPYRVLASFSGNGPTSVSGFLIPLNQDMLFQRLLNGWNPPALSGGSGFLDSSGQAVGKIVHGPYLAANIGRPVYLAAATYAPGLGGRLSSVARRFVIAP